MYIRKKSADLQSSAFYGSLAFLILIYSLSLTLISCISYSHTHTLLLSYRVSYLISGGGVCGEDFYPHHQLVLNRALISDAIFTILYLLYYIDYTVLTMLYYTILYLLTYGMYTICSFAQTNAYLKLSEANWSYRSYLELSGAI